jgi:hypothetical protein
MELASSCETSSSYQSTRRHVPEEFILHDYRCEKPQISNMIGNLERRCFRYGDRILTFYRRTYLVFTCEI